MNYMAISPETRVGGYTLVNVDVNYTVGTVTFGGHVKNLFDTYWNAAMRNDGSVTLTNPGGRVYAARVGRDGLVMPSCPFTLR